MISRLGPAPASVPPGQRVYAIGDVHGCASRLASLHAAIERDMAARPCDACSVVHLGDYVDRGLDSAGVIAALEGRGTLAGATVVNLTGNHERMMLDALDGKGTVPRTWLLGGGRESLVSWGADPRAKPSAWLAAVPASHVAFLRALPLYHRVGGYLFVHAGVRPGVPLEKQTPEDLTWTRGPFLGCDDDFGFVVVHGHTPFAEPFMKANRISIDTGAVFGGKLTCAVLEGDTIGLIQS